MAHHQIPQSNARNTNADNTVQPPRRRSTITSLPPDVASSRKSRINRDLLAFLQRPTSSSANPPFQKGIGVYTHVEVPPPPQEYLFPHQRFTQPASRIEFLPLGGPPGRLTRKGVLKADLPDNVRDLYDVVKGTVTREEKEARKAGQPDPRVKFGGLGLPDIMVPSPPSVGGESEDMDIGEAYHNEMEQEQSGDGSGGAARRLSLGEGMKILSVSGRRPSTSGSAAMGGTGANTMRNTAPAPASAAKTTTTATAAGANASGTLYDPSRDPRRRGR